MNDIEQKIENRVAAFRTWRVGRSFKLTRVVQYCGHECVGGKDSTLEDSENEIRGCLGEGFRVDWEECDAILYLCVSESVDHPLDWQKIFRGEHLSDIIHSTLRQAGFDQPEDK